MRLRTSSSPSTMRPARSESCCAAAATNTPRSWGAHREARHADDAAGGLTLVPTSRSYPSLCLWLILCICPLTAQVSLTLTLTTCSRPPPTCR
eukprot:scaffold26211_cov52-Phaeocystis_antarctica.AAC.2